jgi:hypothetical protein
MLQVQQATFEPGKVPVQTRSTVTAERIAKATVQVQLRHGTERLGRRRTFPDA